MSINIFFAFINLLSTILQIQAGLKSVVHCGGRLTCRACSISGSSDSMPAVCRNHCANQNLTEKFQNSF